MKAGIAMAALLLAFGLWIFLLGVKSADHILITEAVVTPLEDGFAGVSVKIDNTGAPDRLISVSSPVAEAQLYSPADSAGPPVQSGGASLALDGAHIRLSGGFEDGDLIPLTLIFADAGKITLKARLSDPKTQGEAGEVGLFGLGGICRVGDGEPAPQISISVEPDGEEWKVLVHAEEFTFSKDLVGLYHVPGTGHGHLYVGGMKLGRLFAPEARIGALPKGDHEIRVTLNTNDHRAYVVGEDPVTATAIITVN